MEKHSHQVIDYLFCGDIQNLKLFGCLTPLIFQSELAAATIFQQEDYVALKNQLRKLKMLTLHLTGSCQFSPQLKLQK